jgi:methyltransferase family protein
MRWKIRDFFVFRGILFVSGEIGAVHLPLKNIHVRFGDNRTVPLIWRPDPKEKSSPDYVYFEGDLRLPLDISNDEIAKISIAFEDQSTVCLAENPTLHATHEDRFLNTGECFWQYLRGLKSGTVLEVGSRARSGITRRDQVPDHLEYIGLDICNGPNVTLVGDIHAISSMLPRNSIDAVFSVSVWEHLSMPWLASLELNRVMKCGALAMINTHQSWPYHEGPWDYFRFSDASWDGLFNAETGFEIVERGMGCPCVMAPSIYYPHLIGLDWQKGFLASRVVVRKMSETKLCWAVNPQSVSAGAYNH